MNNPNKFDPERTFRIIEIPQPTEEEVEALRQAAGIVYSIHSHRGLNQLAGNEYYGNTHKVPPSPPLDGPAKTSYMDGSSVPSFFN